LTTQWSQLDPLDTFTSAGAIVGLATLNLDGDQVVRRVPDSEDAFWREVLRMARRGKSDEIRESNITPESLIRYLGPINTFPYASYSQVLTNDPRLPGDFFRDKIVLIGVVPTAGQGFGGANGDLYPTPFSKTSGALMPSVEVQANIIEDAIFGIAVTPAKAWQNMLFVSLALLLSTPSLIFWKGGRSTCLLAITGSFVLALSIILFVALDVWVATAAPALAIAIAFVSTASGNYWTGSRAKQIRTAFEKYVSGDLVSKIVANPESLKLGGERREITVMFADVAGFTSMSELLSPEAIADVVSLYLNEVTRIILSRGGTVDKYIGDAVMAFWGAPLDDPNHAFHATLAAMEMQESVAQLQPSFRTLGTGEFRLRIGVHSGAAIVGNMGSETRFSYTAIGDTVNLASRLEGVNKLYGTNILVSAETAKQLGGKIQLRPVDRVRVHGRDVPVEVFTPCSELELVTATEVAIAAYRAQKWQESQDGWKVVRNLRSNDPLPKIFEARIAEMRMADLGKDWDGAVTLDKL